MAYKKISSHGSISIPAAMRRELSIEPKDPMVVEQDGGEIRIRPYMIRCSFCNITDDVMVYRGKGICRTCTGKILEKLRRECGENEPEG